MTGKTVWIAGGVVLAVGVAAYLTYQTPAAPDAAGTIVEAKRAHADGTNSFNPAADRNARPTMAPTSVARQIEPMRVESMESSRREP